MSLLNKMKESASAAADKAKEAGKAGQAKLDQAQAKKKLDGLYRDLGEAVHLEKTGQAQAEGEVDRLLAAIEAHIAENGKPETDDAPAAEAPAEEPAAAAETADP
jgi:hypothetical protein